MPITVVGSANMDIIVQCDRLPKPGETLLGGRFLTVPGGKGANQAVAAARLGGEVSLTACLGQDVFGDSLAESLTTAGVDISMVVRTAEAPTGIAMILVQPDGQNSIVAAPGANSLLPELDARIAGSEGTGPILLQMEIPVESVFAALQKAKAKDRFTILNPAPAIKRTAIGLLQLVDIVTPNESECETLVSVDAVDNGWLAGEYFLRHGAKAAVITLGEHGCYLHTPKIQRYFNALEVDVVDTTGAGDAFNGALAHFISEGRDLENAVALANCVAGLSTTKQGAQTSMPTLEELNKVAIHLL